MSVKPARHRGLTPEDIEKLQEASDRLHYLADRDCDCDWCDGHPTDPETSCDVCQARLARLEIDKVLRPSHEGLHPDRLKNEAERIYLELWQRENEQVPCLNGGFGTLELILRPEGQKRIPHVTQRDAQVAATVVQWLGTSCGNGFVREAEKRIEESRALRHKTGLGYMYCTYNGGSGSLEAKRVAEVIATNFVSSQKFPDTVRNLKNAIVQAIKYFEDQHDDLRNLVYDC